MARLDSCACTDTPCRSCAIDALATRMEATWHSDARPLPQPSPAKKRREPADPSRDLTPSQRRTLGWYGR